jgi:hypothetical protein
VDAAWVLRKLKRRADYNVDDFLTPPNEAGVRYFDISRASCEQLEGLAELMFDETTEGIGEKAQGVRRTKIKGEAMEALNLMARILGMIKTNDVAVNVVQATVVRVPAVCATADEWIVKYSPTRTE